VAAIGTIQVAGNANSTPLEVELNTLAARFVARPQDFGTLGSYTAAKGGTFVNALTAQPSPTSNVNLLSFQWPTSGALALIKKVLVSLVLVDAASGTGANVAYPLALFRVHNFQSQLQPAKDGAASAAISVNRLAPMSSGNIIHAGMADSLADIIMVGNPGAAATYSLILPVAQSTVENIVPTIESHPLAQVVGFGINATAKDLIPPGTALWDAKPGELPIILDPMTGFVIQWNGTTPTFAAAAATMVFGAQIVWEEVEFRGYQ
jgi:hypothetical protein